MKITNSFIENSINCANTIIKNCLENKLRCRDPPLSTSRLLRTLGLSEYQERNYWKIAKEVSKLGNIPIYKYSNIEFDLITEVRNEKIYSVNNIPVDYIDCRFLEDKCKITNKGFAFYVYINGNIEKSSLKINAINILNLLAMHNTDLAFGLLSSISGVIYNGNAGFEALLENVLRLIKIQIVNLILPKTPQNLNELLKLSKLLRDLSKQFGFI
ncbi:hypothetical protein Calag_0239 [Caldisphaera lagunensis DSM 15908]|uniref:Uncharacterized protein n=1 Tax=Caldisphaera lagunensis (strain DSM 15908 / JCM 11604 / ANMR 0165 / IC-154) TaxID=1056495 RepID=L0A859_CALLD|nr:hypothetical protein [Caldisphaera lagunensis]AFZ70021.1 hypothetical protein Calag_0239 [Caldisphaera lagunensis DSM 15908]